MADTPRPSVVWGVLLLLTACLVDLEAEDCSWADRDGDGYSEGEDCAAGPGGDCDDTNANIHPGATEQCDAIDRDCNGWGGNWDADGDGYAACGDCDDDDPTTSPGADEVCDSRDNDCDGLVDNEPVDGVSYYIDGDFDGYGGAPVLACEPPKDSVEEGGDCDDASSAIHPGAEEVCDDFDNDCDGSIDEEAAGGPLWYLDEDGDGYGVGDGVPACEAPEGYAPEAGDCDDAAPLTSPGAQELCGGGDEDCDGTVDEAGAADAGTWYLDSDGDGYGQSSVTTVACTLPEGFASESGDCHDDQDQAYPGSHELETPNDGIDTDCDGLDYCTDLNCDAWPDIVVPSHWDQTFELNSTVFWGSESGYSNNDSTPLPTAGAFEVRSADLDLDGYPDLVFAGMGSDETSEDASIVYYNSALGFTSTEVLDSWGAVDVCIEDLDGNGWDDVVLVSWIDDKDHKTHSYVHYNSQFGFLSNDELSHRGAYHCLLEDVDSDGYTDLILGELTREAYPDAAWTDENKVKVFWGDGLDYADDDKLDLTSSGARRGAVLDLDLDGAPDLVFAEFYNGVSYNVSSNIWYGFSNNNREQLPTRGAMDLVAEDLNGDSWPDLVFANLESDTGYAPDSFVYWGSGGGYSTSNRSSLPTNGASWVTSQDLDSDGYTDLVFSSYYDGSYATNSLIYWGSSAGYGSTDRTALPTEGAFRHAVHDLNGDGYPEILFGGYRGAGGTTASTLEIYWGSSSGYGTGDLTELDIVASPGIPLVVGP